MNAMKSLINGSEKITSIFGYWPSFHDAEVIDLHLWRGEVDPDAGKNTFPILTLRMHLWEMTSEVSPEGFLVLRHHTLATMRFHDVAEIKIDGFNHQNAILGLSIITQERGDGLPPYLVVEFEPDFGMGASFKCFRAEVVEAVPCSKEGKAIV